MPIQPPVLDDRDFDDIVREALSRIPGHTPEWTDPRLGDPGRTIIDLFAWMTDTLLYRVNGIPERQRLSFLRLLGQHMRPSRAAKGLVTVATGEDVTDAVTLKRGASVDGPVPFETTEELTVLPVEGRVFIKRTPGPDDDQFDDLVPELQTLYGLNRRPRPYIPTQIFIDGEPEHDGIDLVQKTLDHTLWIALLALEPELVEDARTALGGGDGGRVTMSVGIVPAIDMPDLFEEVGLRGRVPVEWQVFGSRSGQPPEYFTLDVREDSDTTQGLTDRGVMRMVLPGSANIRGDAYGSTEAGVGDRPPRLDDPDLAGRLVTWIRMRPAARLERLALSWCGINAVEIDQRRTITRRIAGQSDGTADQTVKLPISEVQSVEVDSLRIEVEHPVAGYELWQRVDDLGIAGRDSKVFELDAEAGTITFGDGVRGRVPLARSRIRIATLRAGGGVEGNLPAGTLQKITAVDVETNKLVPALTVAQPLPTLGGEAAETLAEAERRVPQLFQHRDRAVTESDLKILAAEAPGVHVGRVEVLPRFKPHTRRFDVPGVVSVVALPHKDGVESPAPRPDRPFIESVFGHLDARRPLATELYVIGVEYIPIGLSIAVGLRAGAPRAEVLQEVRRAVRTYVWALPPGGPQKTGWPLGKTVREREIEVIVSQVEGVAVVEDVRLFQRRDSRWRPVQRRDGEARLALREWQLPELLNVVTVVGRDAPDDLTGGRPEDDPDGAAIPVVPEVC